VNRQTLLRTRAHPCFCKPVTGAAHFPTLDTMCDKTGEKPNQSHPGQLGSENLIPSRWSCLNQHCERTQKGKHNGRKGSASQQQVSSWRARKSETAVITDCSGLQRGGDTWITSRAWQQLGAFSRRDWVLTTLSTHSVPPALAHPPWGSQAGATSQGCTKAQESKGGCTFEKLEKCCLSAVKSPRARSWGQLSLG